MDDKLLAKMTDSEKKQLKELKQQLDDGIIRQKEFDKKHKLIIDKIRRNHRPKWLQALILVVIAVLAGAFVYAVLNPEPDHTFKAQVQDEPSIMSPSEISITYSVTNHGKMTKNAICDIFAKDENDKILGTRTDSTPGDNIPPNSEGKRMGTAVIKIHDDKSDQVKKFDIYCKRKF